MLSQRAMQAHRLQPTRLNQQRLPLAAAAAHLSRNQAARRQLLQVATLEVETKKAATTQEPKAEPQEEAGPLGSAFKDALLLQGFGWESCNQNGQWYNIVKSKIPDIKAAGIDHVWLPPPSQSVAPQGYLPGQLYDLNTAYGTEEQLIQLNKALAEADIVPVADIVINHRCAPAQSKDGKWNNYANSCSPPDRRDIDWGRWAITGDDPVFGGKGNPDTGEDFGAAPDLDHLNDELRLALVDWLCWLRDDVGFKGWRFDYVKGFGAWFMEQYIGSTLPKGSFNVGELWVDMEWGNDGKLQYNQDGPRQRLCDWVDGAKQHCTVFDFATKGILQAAVGDCEYWRLRDQNGKAPGLIGWWPQVAVTFIDNHDTGSSQSHWPFPSHSVATGYAYIMTHPGVPTIFWEHLFDWGEDLKKEIMGLVDIRRRNGIVSDSKLEILAANHDLYVARVGDKLTIKMGPAMEMGDLVPREEDGWKLATYGKDYAIWEKAGLANGNGTGR